MGDETEAEAQNQSRRWWWTASFKARLGCCGAAWGFSTPNLSVSGDDDVDQEDLSQTPDPGCVSLAAALAAERELRAVQEQQRAEEVTGTPPLGEAEGGGGGCCCVCMERKKDAAFIPCGHSFCRTCAREIRVGRGSCPLCNGRILEILNIF
uniref:RING-type domain-containing protein n=1 Tax=Kalanchoe fedtschenkoi TaxID=63787 RepID=A0A7N0VCQ5_KALFE